MTDFINGMRHCAENYANYLKLLKNGGGLSPKEYGIHIAKKRRKKGKRNRRR